MLRAPAVNSFRQEHSCREKESRRLDSGNFFDAQRSNRFRNVEKLRAIGSSREKSRSTLGNLATAHTARLLRRAHCGVTGSSCNSAKKNVLP